MGQGQINQGAPSISPTVLIAYAVGAIVLISLLSILFKGGAVKDAKSALITARADKKQAKSDLVETKGDIKRCKAQCPSQIFKPRQHNECMAACL